MSESKVDDSSNQNLKISPYYWFFGILLFVLGISLLFRKYSEWELVYVQAGKFLLAGEDPYDQKIGYSYPMFSGWAAIPFVFAPPFLSRLIWIAVNFACLIFLVRGAWFLTGGRNLQGNNVPVREHFILLAGLGCGITYVLNCLFHHQTDILIAALLVAGCLALSRSQSILAATWIGLAAAMKCTSLLFLPYFLWRGNWQAASWLLVVAVGANLLPDLSCPHPNGSYWLQEYYADLSGYFSQPDYVPGTWKSADIYNQGLAGASKRFLSGESSFAFSPRSLRLLLFSLEIGLLLITAWVMGKPFQSSPNQGTFSRRELIEYNLILLLMLLLSPMSSPAHFGILIFPGMLLARMALLGKNAVAFLCVLAAIVLSLGLNKDLVGQTLYTYFLFSGFAMWAAVSLFLGCLVALPKSRWEETARPVSISADEFLKETQGTIPKPPSKKAA